MNGTRAMITLLCAGVLAATPSFSSAAEAERPNILFILADDLGWPDVSGSGQQGWHTPHIDRIAAEGMRFTSAYAASPVCSPTRNRSHSGE